MTKTTTKTPTIMFQGTGSSVGKSLIVAGLCRLFYRKGISVAPFKPQNMSNNAAATIEGKEIGRAQALQAIASNIEPSSLNNPILLKPQNDSGSQLIINGEYQETVSGSDYQKLKGRLIKFVIDSYNTLSSNHDLILVEGAGSPAEINLRKGDIANMGFATELGIPTLIIGDIDRGGVIASIVGTNVILSEKDKNNIVGFIINKFRGDASLFENGIQEIQKRTSWDFYGLVPFYNDACYLPAEDSHDLDKVLINSIDPSHNINIAIPIMNKISNFDDLDPLRIQKNINLVFIRPNEALPEDTDIVLLIGSKSTIKDMLELKANGWDKQIINCHKKGGIIIGLCGGYQMLGKMIHDPEKIESSQSKCQGLGLLDITTIMKKDKIVNKVSGRHIQTDSSINGYEIHLGQTEGPDCSQPLFYLNGRFDGATSMDKRVYGTYLHGFFHNKELIQWLYRLLNKEIGNSQIIDYEKHLNKNLDNLSDHLEKCIDWEQVLKTSKKYAE